MMIHPFLRRLGIAAGVCLALGALGCGPPPQPPTPPQAAAPQVKPESDQPKPGEVARAGHEETVPPAPVDPQPPRELKPLVQPASPLPSPPGQAPVATKPAAPASPPAEKPVALNPADPHAAAREPLFADWPKPDFTLVFSGRQNGYLEPCGCAGLTNQKGGLARRYTFLKRLSADGWNPVPLDVGGQVRRFGRQQEIKFQRTASAFAALDYAAIAYSADDLRLSGTELYSAADGVDGKPVAFVGANVNVLGETKRTKIVAIAGKKLGITAILGDRERLKVNNGEVELKPAAEALGEALAELKAQQADFLILLANASIDETIRLVQKYPEFQVVCTSGGADEPPATAELVPGTKTWLVQTGGKGMYVSALGIYAGADPRFQRVPLDARFKDSPEMLKVLAQYQQELEAIGLAELGVRPTPHPSGRKFVGSQKCGECHTKAFASWEQTTHSHATESLVHPPERVGIARHFDPECLSCHVTGWEPQKFFPFTSGYESLEKSKHLHGSGCENCHGPGSAHVAAEEGGAAEAMLKLRREEMKLPLAGGKAEQKCLECHDLDNSPDFHKTGAFEKYWEKVKHLGKD